MIREDTDNGPDLALISMFSLSRPEAVEVLTPDPLVRNPPNKSLKDKFRQYNIKYRLISFFNFISFLVLINASNKTNSIQNRVDAVEYSISNSHIFTSIFKTEYLSRIN